MEWDELRYLLAASRAGTLARAAQALGVNQTTAGRTLARLEAKLGAKLVSRTRTGLRLSPLAEQLLPSIELMEQRAYEVERRAAGEDLRLAGVVRVATTDAFADQILMPAVPGFLERYPGLSVELVTGNDVVDLARRAADVSIRTVRPSQPSLVARKACELSVGLYASPAYLARAGKATAANGFRGHAFIGYAGPSAHWAEAKWIADHARSAAVALRVSSVSALVSACAAGLGLALLPSFLGDRDASLVQVLGPEAALRKEIWVVLHQDIQKNARVRAFVAFLDELLAREAPRLRGDAPRASSAGRRA